MNVIAYALPMVALQSSFIGGYTSNWLAEGQI